MPSTHQPRIEAVQICSGCGGSGMLRLGDQRYRTCMGCLGQGRLAVVTSSSTVVELLEGESLQRDGSQLDGLHGEHQRAAEVIALDGRRRFNGPVSSSVAR